MGGEYTEGLLAELYIWFFFCLLIGIATAIAFYCYKKGWFEKDDTFYLCYRLFWLFIAFQLVLLMLTRLCCGSDITFFYEDKNDYIGYEVYDDSSEIHHIAPSYKAFWHNTALWALLVLTTTFGPAIRQNRSEVGLDGIILFLADCCGLLYLLFYLSLPTNDAALLLAYAVAVTLFAVLVTLALGCLKPLKRAIKDLLFYFAVGLTVIAPLLFIGALHSLYS
jgi:hypothetical protein